MILHNAGLCMITKRLSTSLSCRFNWKTSADEPNRSSYCLHSAPLLWTQYVQSCHVPSLFYYELPPCYYSTTMNNEPYYSLTTLRHTLTVHSNNSSLQPGNFVLSGCKEGSVGVVRSKRGHPHMGSSPRARTCIHHPKLQLCP